MFIKIKEMFSMVAFWVGKTAFWFLIIFLAGVAVGCYTMQYYQKCQMEDAIMLKCFVFDKTPYDIKLRP